ncbi:MAG: hypothetical protein JW776_11280 [Candidatus Lokiarchaeota archaeon]|nr:hypothetical protein [Candidatus Lokiarchaeota archaeon]
MPDKDRIELIYTWIYSISTMVISGISVILLFATKFVQWKSTSIVQVRLSSEFRLSVLVILPLILGFASTGTLSGMILFMKNGDKDKWNLLIFWVSLGILTATIIAGGAFLIALSAITTSWFYGTSFIGSLIGSSGIALSSFLFYKIKDEIRT